MTKKYRPQLWDIQFYKVDEDGNELLNADGSVKLFTDKRGFVIDYSWINDNMDEEDSRFLGEIDNEEKES
jgi:hypothetical protein